MPDKPKKPSYVGTRTGVMPRVDVEPDTRQETDQPATSPTLPEFDEDSGGITGVIPLRRNEGEDEAKHADDSATDQLAQA
ncbi:MAG: hypothetical protein H6672_14065 [Anaerolineaceae bacterium]|nr:hypothetical protein [Anaerolineaceae bacterium]